MADKPVTLEKLLESAQYAAAELPVRLARRIQAMQQLPYIVGLNPHIRKIYMLYQESFEKIRAFPSIDSIEAEEEFTDLLSDLVHSHADVVPGLARGVEECKQYMTEAQVTTFLDSMIQARIGIRVIAEHHLALHEDVPNYSGVINHRLMPRAMIMKTKALASELCEANFGSSPDCDIVGHTETSFPYIDVHLEYMLLELLKNAFRATVEHSRDIGRSTHPPLQVTIGRGSEDITIRIRDQGGGMSARRLKEVWGYSFSTVSRDQDFMDSAAQMGVVAGTGGPIAGLGYGLPMCRIYAQWAGGSLRLVSLEGYGTDVFLRLPFIVTDDTLPV